MHWWRNIPLSGIGYHWQYNTSARWSISCSGIQEHWLRSNKFTKFMHRTQMQSYLSSLVAGRVCSHGSPELICSTDTSGPCELVLLQKKTPWILCMVFPLFLETSLLAYSVIWFGLSFGICTIQQRTHLHSLMHSPSLLILLIPCHPLLKLVSHKTTFFLK